MDGLVADGVAVGEVFGDDAGAGLVFLFDVVLVLVLGFVGAGCVAAGDFVDGVGGLDVHGGGAKLSVVKKEGSFGGSIHELVSNAASHAR